MSWPIYSDEVWTPAITRLVEIHTKREMHQAPEEDVAEAVVWFTEVTQALVDNGWRIVKIEPEDEESKT